MKDRQREALLDRIRRTSATVGRSMPETVTLAGESVPVRDFYLDVADSEELDPEERQRVEDLLTHLRRERLRLVQRIRNDEVSYERGEELVSEIGALERAIDAFESLDEPGLAEEVRQERVESARELVEILRRAGR